jgi:hypothetical protein
MKRCIVTISRGERPWFHLNEPIMKNYARSCDADFIRGEDLNVDLKEYKTIEFGRKGDLFLFERMPIIYKLLQDYDRVLWLDDTCVISKWCPNIFDSVPYGYIGVHNEGILDWVSSVKRTKELLSKNNHPLQLSNAQYFNNGVALVDKTHAHLYEKSKLLYYGELGYFSDNWIEQTYMNIVTRMEGVPIFELPNMFNRMMIFNKTKDYQSYENLFKFKKSLYVDLDNVDSFVNDNTVSIGGHNHAFIWHLTSFWDTESKTKLIEALSNYGFE